MRICREAIASVADLSVGKKDGQEFLWYLSTRFRWFAWIFLRGRAAADMLPILNLLGAVCEVRQRDGSKPQYVASSMVDVDSDNWKSTQAGKIEKGHNQKPPFFQVSHRSTT